MQSISTKTLGLLLSAIFFLWLTAPVFGQTYDIRTASIYQSSSNSGGTPVCTNLEIDDTPTNDPDTCGQQIVTGATYRFEFQVANTNLSFNGSPTAADFRNVYASGSAIGSNATLVGCGCYDGATKTGTSFVPSGSNARCTYVSPNICTVPWGEDYLVRYYFIITIGSNAANDTDPRFYVVSGVKSDLSETFTMAVTSCGNGALDAGEECDDGNQINTDACNNSCLPAVCGDGIVQVPETCDAGADQPNGVCFSNECNAQICACAKNSGGLKITAIKIVPGTFTAGNAPQTFDANVFVNDTNRSANFNAIFDYNVGIFNTADNGQVAEVSYLTPENSFKEQLFGASATDPVFIINLNPQTATDKFKALPAGSYRATVQIKRDSDEKIVAQKDAFFSITSSVSPVAVSETSPLLSVIAAFLVLGIILGKPVFGGLKLKR